MQTTAIRNNGGRINSNTGKTGKNTPKAGRKGKGNPEDGRQFNPGWKLWGRGKSREQKLDRRTLSRSKGWQKGKSSIIDQPTGRECDTNESTYICIY
jgi:hypothetical protein